MVENLLEYYERELTFLRRLGGGFSRRYPKIAKRLLLEPDKCDDPHVERILEGVAFLAARVHRKLDEEFPEIAGSFIESLLPHYLQPIPSLSIAQVHPKPGKWLDLPAVSSEPLCQCSPGRWWCPSFPGLHRGRYAFLPSCPVRRYCG